MLKVRLFTLLTPLVAAATLPTHGVTLVDGFTDGQLAGGADNSGISWYDRSSNTTISIEDDAILGGGKALKLTISNTTQVDRAVLGIFAPISLTNVGDQLSLSFDFRFEMAPNATFASLNDGFRFGFYNSNGTKVTADNAVQSDDDFGYQATIATGTNKSAGLNKEISSGTILGDLGVGTDRTALSLNPINPPVGINDTEKHSALFTITRTATGLDFSITVDGTLLGTGSDNSAVFTTFDEVLFSHGTAQNYHIDNVEVSVVPEPGTTSLLLLGGVALALRRRRN